MAKRSSAARKTVSSDNLAALGADRLAALLLVAPTESRRRWEAAVEGALG